MTLPVFLVCLYLCIFVVGISLLTKILPSFRRAEIKWLILFVIGVCVISFCSLNVYVSDSFEVKVLFSRWRFIGFGVLAHAWFFFLLLNFTNIKLLRHPLIVLPVVAAMLTTVTIAVVPSLGHLLTGNYIPFHYHGANVVKFSNGPWFGVYILIVYLFALSAIVYALFAIPLSSGSKRKQLMALSLGAVIGLAVDIYCVYTDSPMRWAMLSGVGFFITECSILYAINKHGLLDLSNVAKNQIFNNISDPVLIIDPKGNLIDANSSAKQTFKLSNKELSERLRNLSFFVDFDISLPTQEWSLRDLPNKVRHFQVTSETLKSSSGRVLIFHEITAQKEIVFNLESHLDFKAKLLEVIAHDFSGILSAQSYLSSRLEKEVSPELRASAGSLTNSAYASEDFMSNILLWARAQENQFKLITKDYELNALVSDVVNNLESVWQIQKIKIEIDSKAKSLILRGDVVMIESIVRNLLTNAIRASRVEGNIRITLTQDNTHAFLTIADSGVGMSAEKLEMIKSNSLNVFNSKNERPNGFGLGLIIVKRFVELHHGQIDFNSVVGEGTSVKLTLPL